MRKVFIPICLLLTILVGFGLGYYFNESTHKACPPEELDFSLFWEAYHKIQEKFSDKDKFNEQEIIYGAISGAIKSLEDPYTVFLDPEDTKRFIEDVQGTFEGVGMEIGIREGQLTIIAPLEGTPAQRAGVRAGDKIVKIDDEVTIDMAIDQAVDLIRGPKGTKITLTIFRNGQETPKEIEIERAVIEVPSLKWELKEENIAYIKLYHFSEKIGYDFRQTAKEILDSPAQRIILDLRNNPGGYLEMSREIAGWFLKKGEVVVIEDFGQEKEEIEYKTLGPATFSEYPLVVLINQGSASASEILAGALRDNRGIKLIGQNSFGKGSVQELEKLREGSSLKITVAKWLTPKRELIADVGLKPDIEVEITEEDYQEERDPQLDKAIETIKEIK